MESNTSYKYISSWRFHVTALITIMALILWAVSGCKVAKQTTTIHDTLIQKEGGKTEYLYQDTGSIVTEYFPYVVRVADTFYQPIFKTIVKEGKTIRNTDSFYINKNIYQSVYKSSKKRTQFIPWWAWAISITLLIYTLYDIFKK